MFDFEESWAVSGDGGSSGQIFTFSNDGRFQYPKDVVIPNNVTSLTGSNDGFRYHSEVENISFEIGSTMSEISSSAFYVCSGLKIIELPETITSIKQSAFRECSNLATIKIPSAVTLIDQSAFRDCSSLKNITLDESDSRITLGAYSFSGSGVTDDDVSALLKNRPVTVYSNVFENCLSLKNLNVPITWDTMFQSCKNLQSVIIRSTSESSTGLGNNTFNNCTSLTSVMIDRYASLSYKYFYGCSALKTVIFNKQVTSTYFTNSGSDNPFYSCRALEDLQIPEGWTESILLSNGSSNFTNVLTHDSMVAMIANLYDYSGDDAHTLTLGATNLARLSAEEIAVATAKNWTVA